MAWARSIARRRVVLSAGIGIVVGLALAAVVAWAVGTPSPASPPQPARFAIVPPPAQPLSLQGVDRKFTISPGGTHLVYRIAATVGPPTQLAIRALNELEGGPLAGATGREPFNWSEELKARLPAK